MFSGEDLDAAADAKDPSNPPQPHSSPTTDDGDQALPEMPWPWRVEPPGLDFASSSNRAYATWPRQDSDPPNNPA